MGAPESGLEAAEQPKADALLTAFRTIKEDERSKHEEVLDYWLSIRGDKEFPPLHDLDPLEISDAAPSSILFELLSGGQDAEIRHLGDFLKDDVTVQRVIDASNPSLLSSIARKLPIVAISREFLAFEDNFSNADGLTRCWVTLLPLSSCGSWVDYVYAFVSLEKSSAKAARAAPRAEEAVAEQPAATAEAPAETAAEDLVDAPAEEVAEAPAPVAELPAEVVQSPAEPDAGDEPERVETVVGPEPESAPEGSVVDTQPEPEQEPEFAAEPPALEPEPEVEQCADEPAAKGSPGFSGILEGLASLAGFYGQGVKVTDPVVEVDLRSEAPPVEPESELEPLELEAVAPAEAVMAEPEATEPLPDAEAVEPAAEVPPLELDVPVPALEGTLHDKLTEVRAKADEARQAALRATAALHEGLSAAYDFALDAETSPEEYLRLVEAEGLKIQLRAPMAPVARLAFDGLVDAATLGQCEKILAWALKEELPRGALLERIDQAGGISELVGELKAA